MLAFLNGIIPVICFVAGLFIGFYMHKEDEIPTVRKVYRKRKLEKRQEEQEDKEYKDLKELQEFMKSVDEFGVK